MRIYDIFETNTSLQKSAITRFLRQENLNQDTVRSSSDRVEIETN